MDSREWMPGPLATWPQTNRPTVRYRPGLGLAAGIAGLVLVALSLFVLEWVDLGSGTFTFWKLSEIAREGSGEGADPMVYTYVSFGGFVLFGLAAVWVLLAGVPIPATRGGARYQCIVGSLICGGAAVCHTVVVESHFLEPFSPEIGAWLGVVGYFVIVAGMVIGVRRVAG